MKKEYNFELNGYSNFFTEKPPVKEAENFTLTMVFTPYTYETAVSGILSSFSADEKQGIAIGIMKRGIVTVKIGLCNMVLDFESVVEHLKFQKRNIISVAFWGTAGWCDLYVNGIMSNRKQFKRHTKVIFPAGECYIGKYVDKKDFLPSDRHSVFHGRLESIEFTAEYMNYGQVISSHSRQRQEEKHKINLYEMQDFSHDIYKPVYHMMPPGKWMNEPHAPFYYGGQYHIFYQANPHAPVWDNLCWGHLTSKDMIKWKDAGIALYPDDENLDIDGCWSGSACLDFNGIPMLFYTAGNNKELPNQGIAVAQPADQNDPDLENWTKQGVILRQTVGEGFLGEFRDPFVWKKEDLYYILVGTGDSENGGGNALLYTSKDLKDFECHGFVTDYNYEQCNEVGHVWELPVLLPVRNESGEHCGEILMFCACQTEQEVVETYYFLGEFDYENKTFRKSHELPMLFDLGYGTFTGGCGFVTPDKRSVVFTIAQGKRNPVDEYNSGWAHNGGMPVGISVQKGVLQIVPVAEIRQYFSGQIYTAEITQENFNVPVLQKENLFQNRLLVTSKGEYLEMILECEDDSYIISYDRNTQEWKAVSGRTGKRISRIQKTKDLVDIGQEEIKMECYVDHSMVEIYLNNRKSMTLRCYPLCKRNRFMVKTDGECRVTVWKYDESAGI